MDSFKEFLNQEMAQYYRSLPKAEQVSGVPAPPIIQSQLKVLKEGTIQQTPHTEERLVGTSNSTAISNAIGPR